MFSMYQVNAAHQETLEESVGRLCGGWRWGGWWWVRKKRAPVRDHERDIVQNRPYSLFVDKWISMLINWDTDMTENCGECGIIPTRPPYTPTTVGLVPRVWSIPSTAPRAPQPPSVRLQVPLFSVLAEGVPLKFLCFRTKAPHHAAHLHHAPQPTVSLWESISHCPLSTVCTVCT